MVGDILVVRDSSEKDGDVSSFAESLVPPFLLPHVSDGTSNDNDFGTNAKLRTMLETLIRLINKHNNDFV